MSTRSPCLCHSIPLSYMAAFVGIERGLSLSFSLSLGLSFFLFLYLSLSLSLSLSLFFCFSLFLWVPRRGCKHVHARRVRVHAKVSPSGLVLPKGPLGPLGFDFAQHRQTLRPSADGVRSKALRPFESQ